jgi:cytochrome P450
VSTVQLYSDGGDSAHVLNSWRRVRRAAHEALTKRAIQNYHSIQMKEATILTSSLLMPSTDRKQDRHFRRTATSTIMSILYDYPTVMSEHDHAVEKIEKFIDHLSHALAVGSYFVDIFPWMNHIPERYSCLFRCLSVSSDRHNQSDSQNGSGKACEHLKSTLRYLETF